MNRALIDQGFWADRLAVNAQQAIYHQWEQLEASGCIENFRIASGESRALRTGWFFADSDAYKWLDAAARIWRESHDPRLGALMDEFIRLLARAQMPDGYLFTYNQIHFQGVRWKNLQIEHELYCHGHFIEAGVSHFEATGRTDLLTLARKAADRIVADFSRTPPDHTPGHEEIEIALLRLHDVIPGDTAYLDLARQFIENRGKTRWFGWQVLCQLLSVNQRGQQVTGEREKSLAAHPEASVHRLPPGNPAKIPPLAKMRWAVNALNGKFFQQHQPLREQRQAEGHAVRFAYLHTAAAMLARRVDDRSLIPPLESAWDSMVLRRMYVTGGIGSLPEMEGFGNDYELDDEYAYAETCAALGSLFWNWEMACLTGEARYSDLFEWQLYNAAAVGMGSDGKGYFFNNPLACRTEFARSPWFAVPCCPSNLSRTFADLGGSIYSAQADSVLVHQYIGSTWTGKICPRESGKTSKISIQQESALPWQGKVRLEITPEFADGLQAEILFRQPSWAGGMRLSINDGAELQFPPVSSQGGDAPASGYDPRRSVFRSIRRNWSAGDVVELGFEMPVTLRHTHPRVKGHQNKVALTRGPLVFCLESPDNPGIDLFSLRLDPGSIEEFSEGSAIKLRGQTRTGKPLIFVPYHSWGNRGPSQMTVWVNT